MGELAIDQGLSEVGGRLAIVGQTARGWVLLAPQ